MDYVNSGSHAANPDDYDSKSTSEVKGWEESARVKVVQETNTLESADAESLVQMASVLSKETIVNKSGPFQSHWTLLC